MKFLIVKSENNEWEFMNFLPVGFALSTHTVGGESHVLRHGGEQRKSQVSAGRGRSAGGAP